MGATAMHESGALFHAEHKRRWAGRARQQDRPYGVGDAEQGRALQRTRSTGGVNEIAPVGVM